MLAVATYSFVVTFVIGSFLDRLIGNRVSPRAESIGVDLTQHGEAAYQLEPGDPLQVARSGVAWTPPRPHQPTAHLTHPAAPGRPMPRRPGSHGPGGYGQETRPR